MSCLWGRNVVYSWQIQGVLLVRDGVKNTKMPFTVIGNGVCTTVNGIV